MADFDLVVIGTSFGGVEALSTIVRSLPSNLDAAVLVVMHVGPKSTLPAILASKCSLPCQFVTGDFSIEAGHIYVAPPDYHLHILDGHAGLFQGPKENHNRPSINPLFRSAAQFYKMKVIGVILTGMLNDGAEGLSEIKAMGGITVVQDPEDALAPSMPSEAMRRSRVDHRLPIQEIGPLLSKLVGSNNSTVPRNSSPMKV